MVERVLAKDEVAGSSPVSRSIFKIFSMSKRNRNKKKKQKIQKKTLEYSGIEKPTTTENPNSSENFEALSKKQESPIKSIIDDETRKFIAKDVKMIIITLIALGVILVGVKILQSQTDLIDNLGNWLVGILNINTR